MTCTADCRKPHGRQAHCGATSCHQTFSGLTAFDHHRVGPVGERRCTNPAERDMHLDARGVWREGGTRPRYWDAPSAHASEPRADENGSGVLGDTPRSSEAGETISGGRA